MYFPGQVSGSSNNRDGIILEQQQSFTHNIFPLLEITKKKQQQHPRYASLMLKKGEC